MSTPVAVATIHATNKKLNLIILVQAAYANQEIGGPEVRKALALTPSTTISNQQKAILRFRPAF
ncbi:hypothetical protein [Rufibacter roseus]|uniref:Uncharacterized protein n=1 Tax=Rufibacter roseus TaxID=1567108 RepID=A0ABW2DLP2_9BACT|nr:hypothetical protein [Rufibacter roseus]